MDSSLFYDFAPVFVGLFVSLFAYLEDPVYCIFFSSYEYKSALDLKATLSFFPHN